MTSVQGKTRGVSTQSRTTHERVKQALSIRYYTKSDDAIADAVLDVLRDAAKDDNSPCSADATDWLEAQMRDT
jgi:hypothetical protein